MGIQVNPQNWINPFRMMHLGIEKKLSLSLSPCLSSFRKTPVIDIRLWIERTENGDCIKTMAANVFSNSTTVGRMRAKH